MVGVGEVWRDQIGTGRVFIGSTTTYVICLHNNTNRKVSCSLRNETIHFKFAFTEYIHLSSLISSINTPIMARDGEPLHRSLVRDTTAYLSYILMVVAIGPLQFGFHLVPFFS